MHAPERIMVYRIYRNSFEASIAKSLLDSFGVPSFLSQEMVTNLYGPVGMGVRLHIFESDKDLADDILTDLEPGPVRNDV